MRAKKLEVEDEGKENKKLSFRRYSVSVRQEDFYLLVLFFSSLSVWGTWPCIYACMYWSGVRLGC